MRKLYLLVLAAALCTYSSGAQAQIKGKVEMMQGSQKGKPSFVRFSTTEKALPASQKEEVLKEYLELEPADELKSLKVERDAQGFDHEKLQQYYKGVKVEYGTYKVHSKNNVIHSINGQLVPIKDLSVQPKLSRQSALQKALQHVNARTYMWELDTQYKPEGELIVVNNFRTQEKGAKKPVLAYKFNIYAEQPLSRSYVYVDASNGEIVHENAIIKHATTNASAATRYSGTQTIQTDSYSGSYRLRDFSRGNGVETYDMNNGTNYSSASDFVDADNSWTAAEYDNADKNNAALDAHWGAQQTYDYFLSAHNRNSWDGNGAKIKSYVHYSSNYENAFWNGSVMTYGDGDTRFDALTSLDVAAHEIGHAVCEKTANLAYQKESGAMNEGFSDIWAASVEYYAAPNKATWLVGEDIDKQQAALRSMSDPNSQGQPDTYGGSYWINPNCTPSRSNDYCGVHTNSGVLNYWFYLLSVGGSGTNDLGNSFGVAGITIEDAAKIAYRLESVYLSANSTFAEARTYGIQSAIDLFGEGSQQHISTANAWHAVGVGGRYGEIAYCTSQGNDASYEWISNVSIGSFTNSSASASYTDFTGTEIDLNAGQNYSVSLTPGFSGSSYNEYWKIWIDYNADGDFSDAGELVFDAGSLSSSTVNGNFTVASSASGSTRMRVSMKYEGAQTACESFNYGEVEDYAVTFGTATATCDTPTGLTTGSVTSSSATLDWAAVSGASTYDVRYRATGTTSWTTTSTSGSSKSVSGLSASTQYEFQVRTVCSSSSSAYSSSETFTTSAAVVSYCASAGSNSSYEWIDLVSLNEVNNATGDNGGYGDYTNLTANIAPGGSYTITISAGFSGTTYKEYWKVWIDLNQDGDFTDSGEELVSGSATSANNLTATLNIPSSASLGTTRMRVSMKYNAEQTSCETFNYGEVEDYTVNITSGSFDVSRSTAQASGEKLEQQSQIGFMAPNPADDIVKLNLNGFREDVQVQVFDIQGRQMKATFNADRQQLDVSTLKGGIYMVKVFSAGEMQVHRLMKD